MRRVLVASQVAFAFMLLIGAGLLLASFERVLRIEPGFDPEHLLTARSHRRRRAIRTTPQLQAFADRLLASIRTAAGRDRGRASPPTSRSAGTSATA